MTSGSRGAAPAFLERMRQVGPGGLPCRDETKEQSRPDRNRCRCGQDAPVQRNRADARHVVRHGVREHPHGPERQDHGQQRPDRGQHEALDEARAHQPPAAGAERGTHAGLALARACAGQEQRGDVDARNQQHDGHGAEEHQHPRPRPCAHDVIAKRAEANRRALAPLGMRRQDAVADPVHVGLRLLDGDAWLQPAGDLQVDVDLLRDADPLRFRDDIGEVQVRRTGCPERPGEALRHDADDVEGLAIERERPADDGGLAAVAALPQSVAQDRHALAAGDFVVSRERVPHDRLHAQHVEEAGRRALHPEVFRFAAGLLHGHRPTGDGGHGLEHLLLGGPVHVVLGRGAGDAERIRRGIGGAEEGRTPLADGDEPVVFVEWQAAQHDRVDDGEDGRRGADAQRKDDQRNGREGGRGPERTQGGDKVSAHAALDAPGHCLSSVRRALSRPTPVRTCGRRPTGRTRTGRACRSAAGTPSTGRDGAPGA